MKLKRENDTKIFALGGLGEVGKNMYCFMTGNEIIITDCGITFPDDSLPGVDYIIPDFTFLNKNESKISFVDIQDCLILVVSSFSNVTSYENQTKKSITNKGIYSSMFSSARIGRPHAMLPTSGSRLHCARACCVPAVTAPRWPE